MRRTGIPLTRDGSLPARRGYSPQGCGVGREGFKTTLRQELFLRSNYSHNADTVLDQWKVVLAINETSLIIEGEEVCGG